MAEVSPPLSEDTMASKTKLEIQKSHKVFLKSSFGRVITVAQGVADFLIVLLCYLFSYWFYVGPWGGGAPQTFIQFVYLALSASFVYVIMMDRVGLYRREISLLNIKELRGIFRVGIYAAAVIFSASFYIRTMNLSRVILTTAVFVSPLMLYLQRQIFYKVHLLFHQKGWSQRRVFIFGAGSIGTHLARRMFESPSLGYYPVAFLDDESSKHNKKIRLKHIGPHEGIPVLGGEEFVTQCKYYGVEMVFIAQPSAKFERNQKLVDLCIAHGMDYAIVPNSYEKFIQHVESFEIGGIPILKRRERKLNYLYLFFKRVMDLLISALLIVICSPLILVIGIAIRLDSNGPIIFKQKRVGYRGKEFSFYKFRSMHLDAPKYAQTPLTQNDPRITKVGRWLRRTSLDELPQLFNVFRGDMSLVGPRPEMPFIVKEYSILQHQRLEAKPGITGVWQISAVRGEPIHANIEYDLFYLENRSILLDIAILTKTVLSVIRGIGAV